VVVDGNSAVRGLQHLPAAARRRPERDVAARIGVPDRRHLARLAAEDVEHADPILARRDLRQGADAYVIFEVADALLIHLDLPGPEFCILCLCAVEPQAATAAPPLSFAPSCSRPPVFIHASTARA